MRTPWILGSVIAALGVAEVGAIPQDFGGFGGGFFGATIQPEAIEDDLTAEMIAATLWRGGELPRDWREVPSLDGDEIRVMSVTGPLFGETPEAIFANFDGSRLKSISARYLEAERFLAAAGDGPERKLRERELKKRYAALEDSLPDALREAAEKRPAKTVVGRSTFLRTNYLEYPLGALKLRLSMLEDRSVTLTILRAGEAHDHYMDSAVAELDTRDRRDQLLANVKAGAGGDVDIEGIPMFNQGQRAYCSVSTLGMATHYLGLRMGTDALAAGAKFRSTGSARGAKILELYRAAAQESGAALVRGANFDLSRAQKAIEKGFPVLVWRRYSPQRDRLHAAAARGAALPELAEDDRDSWPTGKDAPAHCSLVTGFNEETGEVIFMESWGEHTRGKRMKAEELEATSYAVFYFKI